MPWSLSRKHDLAILRLSLDRAPDPVDPEPAPGGYAFFELDIKGRVRKPSERPTARISAVRMGLPADLEAVKELRYTEPEYTLPTFFFDAIKRYLDEALDPGEPLWFQLGEDCGHLPIVPWERLLQPELERPILRLPYFDVMPFSDTGCFNVAVCASEPPTEDDDRSLGRVIPKVVRAVAASVSRRPLNVHVFADRVAYTGLERRIRRAIAGDEVNELFVHDPKDGPFDRWRNRDDDADDQPADLKNPWLRWMIKALGADSADAVHFVCHGHLSNVQGTLAFADSFVGSRARRPARFAGAQELASFLTLSGAWAIGFSSPTRNYSAPGLRLLADQISRLRPGPVIVHELDRDPKGEALAEVYGYVTGEGGKPPRLAGAVAFTIHPEVLRPAHRRTAKPAQKTLDRLTLTGDETRHLLQAPEPTPSWVASIQRFMEQSVADSVLPEAGAVAATRGAGSAGTEDALVFFKQLVQRHADPQAGGAAADRPVEEES